MNTRRYTAEIEQAYRQMLEEREKEDDTRRD